MSRLLSDEEITNLMYEVPIGYEGAMRMGAEAQRDSSDKEWIELLEDALEDEVYHNHRIARVWEIVQALKGEK